MGKFKLPSLVSRSMGCKGSKEEVDAGDGSQQGKKAGGSGAASSCPAGTSTTQPTDPRVPMTAKQKYSLVASWKAIHRALEPTGILMFVKLFEENIELLDLFEKFQHAKTRQEQEENVELAEHAAMVMDTLDNAIRTLEKNPDAFIQFVEQVGSSHRRITGFNKDFFWKIEKPFLHAVKTTLDERYTENIENIYKIAIHLIIETLVSGYEKGG